ncbi:hypothetical protein I553_5877 [Mycobacterium xenopi 4042]|uniref:Uncharacterized protein n=1 Tax=Mycobacterium xenopi 4042 TaxID=1299334 RepID=X7ZWW6_MYCXE|nr:hypothetical protein I553_5877 [Mycobacterium xenopi 4042]
MSAAAVLLALAFVRSGPWPCGSGGLRCARVAAAATGAQRTRLRSRQAWTCSRSAWRPAWQCRPRPPRPPRRHPRLAACFAGPLICSHWAPIRLPPGRRRGSVGRLT